MFDEWKYNFSKEGLKFRIKKVIFFVTIYAAIYATFNTLRKWLNDTTN